MPDSPPIHSALTWAQLSADARAALARKLEGLYGAPGAATAFSSLAVDKQQALLLLHRRLEHFSLWELVRRVENVYGTGGVGMSFTAWPGLRAALARHKAFTKLWAAHRRTAGGFRELGRREAVLHFLCSDEAAARRWAVHFDLYNPFSSPAGFFRHWWRENLTGETPDWQAIDKALGKR